MKRILLITVGALLAITLITTLLAGHYRHELYQAGIQSEAAAIGLQSNHVQLGDITWTYWENGLRGQKPTLVLVHGFGASRETWLPMSKHLAQDFHLVIPDLPGHGESGFNPELNYNLKHQTERFSQFAKALNLEQFHLIGNSMGGGITGLYAGTHPDKLLSAILLNPAGIIEYPSDYQQRVARGENPLLVNTVEDLDFLFEYAVAEKITIHWPFNQVMVDRAVAKRPIMNKVFADLTADPEANIKAAVEQIRVPTLVVWGKEDRIIAPENAALYQQLNPTIEIKLLDQVGHIPMVEIPAACADMVLNFTTTASLPGRQGASES